MGDQPLDRQTSRLSLREQLGSRLQSFRASRGKERKRSQDDAVSAAPKGPEVMSPRSRAALARSKQEALDALPADYYQPDYDPVAGELAMLPRMFTEGDLEAVVEERSGVLETVSERLSQHVLSNYSKFVAGVTEVASVERDLQEAYRTAKTSRSELANALAEVRANMVITRKQKQKQGLERMLGTLQQLREAAHLHDALRHGAHWLTC
ncbi:g6822 [Coccomyxa elongata]